MRRRRPRKILRAFRLINALVLVLATGTGGFVIGGLQAVRAVLPKEADLTKYRPLRTTMIYSTERYQDGRVENTLLARIAKEDREPVPLHKMPLALRQGTVAIEDIRFYQHRGIDPKGILRAAWANLRGHQILQGGSTITQQLVRNVWLTQERTLDRKLKEIMLAVQVERKFSKDEILQMYLNEIYYGHGAYGVQSASRTFFGKDVSDLTLGEAGLLAGLPRSPLNYSPYDHPQRCKSRRLLVLQKMVGMGYITADEAVGADHEQIQSRLQPLREQGVGVRRAPHFTNLVLRLLRENPRYGVDALYKGGLQVYTTLDIRLQEIAERVLEKGIKDLRREGRIHGGLEGQGALACVDVHTGDVLAMAGGVGPYEQVQFNRAHPGPPEYGRQPGSSFKPYVYAAAFESGYGPNSMFSGGPISIPQGPGLPLWQPKNYTSGQGGNWRLRDAVAQSVNLVAVRVLMEVGVDKVRSYASSIMDIPRERLRPVISLALGTSELSPLEQASGYAVFASGGWRAKRRFIHTIMDANGAVLESADPRPRRVLREDTAITMISVLGSVVEYGTGTRAKACGRPAGGKTGTTQEDRDAWWVGFTPELSCAVWVGNDHNDPMRRAAGGRFAAPIWAQFIKEASEVLGCDGEFPEGSGVKATRESEPEEEEEAPDDQEQPATPAVTTPGHGPVTGRVTICRQSGGRATPYCPDTMEVDLAPGSPPPPPCWIHRAPTHPGERTSPGSTSRPGSTPPPAQGTVTVTVCTQSGQLATPYCPDTEERSYRAGSQPRGKCSLHGPAPVPAVPPSPPREPTEVTPPSGTGEAGGAGSQ